MKYNGYVYKAAKVKMMHFWTYHRMTKLGMMINKKIFYSYFLLYFGRWLFCQTIS